MESLNKLYYDTALIRNLRGFLVSNLYHVEGWLQWKIIFPGLIKQWTWHSVYSDWIFLFSSFSRSDSCCDLYLALCLCHSCSHLSTEKVIQKKWSKKVRERRQCRGCFEKRASYPKRCRWKSERVLLLIGSNPVTCKDEFILIARGSRWTRTALTLTVQAMDLQHSHLAMSRLGMAPGSLLQWSASGIILLKKGASFWCPFATSEHDQSQV